MSRGVPSNPEASRLPAPPLQVMTLNRALQEARRVKGYDPQTLTLNEQVMVVLADEFLRLYSRVK